jgi:pilus assembly protein Flp/PilA
VIPGFQAGFSESADGFLTVPYLSWSEMAGWTMRAQLRAILLDESGATAIEYAVLAALISLAATVGLQMAGTSLNRLFTDTAGYMSGIDTTK